MSSARTCTDFARWLLLGLLLQGAISPALALDTPQAQAPVSDLSPGDTPVVQAVATQAPSPPTPQPLRIPRSLRLKYAIYGLISHLPYRASGELTWVHDEHRYEAELKVSVFLFGSRVQSSQGSLTPAGLKPLRFVDRVRNDRTVAFDYEHALIRFSEGTPPTPLPSGAQDHLSVFMQLGSLVGSAPQDYPAGTVVTLPAMGIYGPEVWRFVSAGEEQLTLPGGKLRAVRLNRSATRADEPNAEVWLAPDLGWLPARIRLTQDNGDVIDQRWRDSETL